MTTGIQNVNNLTAAYYAATLVFLLLFALYDMRHHKIRNTALAAFLVWCLFSVPAGMYEHPVLPWQYLLLQCLGGFLSGFLILFTIALATNGGIGGGDIKLTALLGIPFGASGLMAVLFLACTAALLHLGIRRIMKKRRPQSIPFAPYLFAGCLAFTLPQLLA